jgi:hypothetical protein
MADEWAVGRPDRRSSTDIDHAVGDSGQSRLSAARWSVSRRRCGPRGQKPTSCSLARRLDGTGGGLVVSTSPSAGGSSARSSRKERRAPAGPSTEGWMMVLKRPRDKLRELWNR